MLNFGRWFLVVWLLSAGLAFASNQVVTLGVLAVRDKAEEQKRWQPLADYLTTQLNIKKVQLQVLNMGELTQQLQNSQLDFLITNPGHYIRLRESNALIGAIATLVESTPQGEPVSAFGGVIFCLRDRADINSLQDLKNKRIAIISRLSLGGYQMQLYELAKHDIELTEEQLLETEMPQSNAVNAVLSGKADAGFVRTDVIERMVKNHKLDLSRIKIINSQNLPGYPYLLSTQLYPQWPFVALTTADPQLARKAAARLLLLEPQHPVVSAADLYGFTIPADYEAVATLLRELRLPPYDSTPHFTLTDVWQRYRLAFLVLFVAGGAITILVILLWRKNRDLHVSQCQLANKQALLRGLIDAIPNPIFFKDKNSKYRGCNKAVEAYFGDCEAEIIGKSDFDFVDAELAALFQAGDKQVFETEEISVREEWITYPDGKQILVEATKIPYYSNRHELLGLIGIAFDMTARNEILQNMREAELKAIAASKAKSEFLANMSHEIRTPMNAILGFSDILNNLITDKTQRYYLDAIQRGGKILLQLINDILDLSKIEAGKFTLQYTPVSLRALLNDVCIIFSQKASEKGLGFSISLPEKLPQGLLLDEIRLRQVLLNLLGNAFKFTHTGFVKIIVEFSVKTPDKAIHLRIDVCDSGIGIPETQQEQIFAAFTQQDNQSAEYGGTGLGLTICTRLMELMGGNIRVESKVGKGSCFSLILNDIEIVDSDSIAEKSTASQTAAVQFQPARILLVDDTEINRLLINAYLEDYPELQVIEAKSGEEALALVHQYRFDLIFMDRIMPGEHGDSVCQKIKALPDYADIPIAMISAPVTGLYHSQEPVFYDVQLNKPVNKDELLAAMQRFLPLETVQKIPASQQTTLACKTPVEHLTATENLSELLVILRADYQKPIVQLASSGALEIDAMIEIAEQLQEVAERYHSTGLKDWAHRLKNQAELFDLESLPETLSGFEDLIKELAWLSEGESVAPTDGFNRMTK